MAKLGVDSSLIHKINSDGVRLRPTISPTPGFSASSDAERLHRAMKGAGTDETTLINILARRTNHERQEICQSFESMYKCTLREDIRSDTSGDFRKVLCELVHDVPYMLAKALYYALKGTGTTERVLIEILPTLWNDEIKAVSKAYKKVLKDKGVEDDARTLEGDIASDTSGDFQYALQCLTETQRDDIPLVQLKALPEKGIETVINKELAEVDAKELYDSGVGRLGTREKRITRIICNRTPFQLNETVKVYEQRYGRSLIDDLKSETSGDYERILLATVRYATERPKLFAQWLHDAIAGPGTRDYALMRILITRSEIDLQDIAETYEALYGESLVEAVKGDTSGDYERTLLALLGQTAK